MKRDASNTDTTTATSTNTIRPSPNPNCSLLFFSSVQFNQTRASCMIHLLSVRLICCQFTPFGGRNGCSKQGKGSVLTDIIASFKAFSSDKPHSLSHSFSLRHQIFPNSREWHNKNTAIYIRTKWQGRKD